MWYFGIKGVFHEGWRFEWEILHAKHVFLVNLKTSQQLHCAGDIASNWKEWQVRKRKGVSYNHSCWDIEIRIVKENYLRHSTVSLGLCNTQKLVLRDMEKKYQVSTQAKGSHFVSWAVIHFILLNQEISIHIFVNIFMWNILNVCTLPLIFVGNFLSLSEERLI